MCRELCATMALKLVAVQEIAKFKIVLLSLSASQGNLQEIAKGPVHLPDLWDSREVDLNSLLNHPLIGRTVQEDGPGLFSIPSCPSGLLKIGLRSIRQIHMDHKTHIGFVDSHPKGIGGHHDPELVLRSTPAAARLSHPVSIPHDSSRR